MKKLILLTLLVSSLNISRAMAQNQVAGDLETPVTSAVDDPYWSVSLSTLQWNEALDLKQAGKSETDVANYSGLSLGIQKDFVHGHWGWNIGGFVGAGRANGGGNGTITYEKDRQSFTIFGLTPRIYWNMNGRISLGLTALLYVRNIDWPQDTAGVSVDPTGNFTATALADLNLRLSKSFDFYQGIGPLNKSATFWKFGLAYRF